MSEELNSYLKHVKFDNEVIYDIGANTGEMIQFFNKHSKNATIVGVEPHPNNIELLNKQFQDVEHIKIIDGAVNTFDGTCYVGFEQQERVNGLKQGHVMYNNSDLQGRNWLKGKDVKCYKFDNLCKDATLIKMDIEGFEHQLLKDSLQNLNHVKCWMLEIHSWESLSLHGWTIDKHDHKNDSLHKMLSLFQENGYNTFILAKKRNINTSIGKNTYWTHIPMSSYMQKGEKVYYKVVNLIIKKLTL